MPEGLPYHDEFFGDMHIYRNAAVVRIPVVRPGAGRGRSRDPVPGLRRHRAVLPAAGLDRARRAGRPRPPATAGQPAGSLAKLLGPRAADPNAPLPPGKVFRVSAELANPSLLRVTWDIAEGYYLYRDSLKVESASPGVQLGALRLPAGTPKEDEYWGKTEVFYEEAVAEVPVTGHADPLQVKISHQGCKEDSICYPPQTVLITVSSAAVAATGSPGGGGPAPVVSEQDRFAGMIGTDNLGWMMLTLRSAGCGSSFTPCCLPMVPILSGIIVGQGKHVTTARAFALSLTYVLGMAVTYTAAGALFAAAGQQIQATLQQPWIIVSVAALFVALALAMFGLYELQVPAALMNRINAASGRQKTGTFVGTAVMGALSALVVTTCVAPPLVGGADVHRADRRHDARRARAVCPVDRHGPAAAGDRRLRRAPAAEGRAPG